MHRQLDFAIQNLTEQTCIERARKHDERSNKKNQRALRTNSGSQDDNYKVELGSQGFSRDLGTEI